LSTYLLRLSTYLDLDNFRAEPTQGVAVLRLLKKTILLRSLSFATRKWMESRPPNADFPVSIDGGFGDLGIRKCLFEYPEVPVVAPVVVECAVRFPDHPDR
jgi:hypothetical protein